MSSSLTRHSTYNYRYASDVVEAFMQKYARVVLFVAYVYEREPWELREKLKKVFMENNVKWNVIRDMLKRLQNREDLAYLRTLDKEKAKTYIHMLRTFAEDSAIEPENWE